MRPVSVDIVGAVNSFPKKANRRLAFAMLDEYIILANRSSRRIFDQGKGISKFPQRQMGSTGINAYGNCNFTSVFPGSTYKAFSN